MSQNIARAENLDLNIELKEDYRDKLKQKFNFHEAEKKRERLRSISIESQEDIRRVVRQKSQEKHLNHPISPQARQGLKLNEIKQKFKDFEQTLPTR